MSTPAHEAIKAARLEQEKADAMKAIVGRLASIEAKLDAALAAKPERQINGKQ